jgi:hypothetical protein
MFDQIVLGGLRTLGHVHDYESTWPMCENGTVCQKDYIHPKVWVAQLNPVISCTHLTLIVSLGYCTHLRRQVHLTWYAG